MYSDIHKPSAEEFFDTSNQFESLQTTGNPDVVLTSASDLGKQPSGKESLKDGFVKLPTSIHDGT